MLKCWCQKVWQQSKTSIHKNIAHLCSYFRSFRDVAEHSEDDKTRKRYQQEALYALRQYRQDDTLSRLEEAFDYGIFAKLIEARINDLNGNMFAAKRDLADSQIQVAAKFEHPTPVMAPNCIKVMLDLAEFEEANKLNKLLTSSGKTLDQNTQADLDSNFADKRKQHTAFSHFNKLGIQCHGAGKHRAACEGFVQAQAVSQPENVLTRRVLPIEIKVPRPKKTVLAHMND